MEVNPGPPTSTFEGTGSAPPPHYIPRRGIVLVLLTLATTITYIQRVSISIAIIPIIDELHLDSATTGALLSSFYYGYLSNIMGGNVCRKFGSKRVLVVSFILGSLCFVFFPSALILSPTLGIVVNLLGGLFQGVFFPAGYGMISNWFTRSEFATVTTVFMLGVSIGTIAALSLAPYVVAATNWQTIFYLAGFAGLVCAVFFEFFSKEHPSQDEKFYACPIHESELAHIMKDKKPYSGSHRETPWKKIFTSAPVWAMWVNHFALNWCAYLFLSWLPTYVNTMLNYDLRSTGVISFTPYVLVFGLQVLSGYIRDKLVKSGSMTLLNGRKLFQGLALAIPITCLLILSLMKDIPVPGVLALLIIAIGANGFATAGLFGNNLELSQYSSSDIFGVSNTLATLPGIAGVYLVGLILEYVDPSIGWPIVFIMTACIMLVALVVWFIFASSDNVIDGDEMDETTQEEEMTPLVGEKKVYGSA